jgi:hypothetical protein
MLLLVMSSVYGVTGNELLIVLLVMKRVHVVIGNELCLRCYC